MGDHADIDRQVRTYILVFVSLMALTIITVTISRFHLPVPAAVTVALIVACIKGGLVASYFMHLISERKLIYWVLGFTVLCFFTVLLLPLWTHYDPILNH
ncbi:MAG: cytochrome C oxidase subunit IV family protein [Thermoanaerobaculia bacterium]|jgi:cytochrome c oxidase subunit 4